MTANAVQLGLLTERQFRRVLQDELFHHGEVGAPYVSGSSTSKAAAKKIAPKVSRLEEWVLTILYDAENGLTDEEIDNTAWLRNGSRVSTLRPRRIGLTHDKWQEATKANGYDRRMIRPALIEDSGETRLTRYGNKATVWRLNEAGRQVAEERAK